MLDLKNIPTAQLKEIKKILTAGVLSSSETRSAPKLEATSQLCHKSPPKGYPKEKSEYGDPECYRYPLNTKSRAMSAWRYIHQADNKSILGDKFKTVEGNISSYAKSNYNLDLKTSESEEFNWEQAFVEYYDNETMGERCDNIVLEPEESEEAQKEDKTEMENEEKVKALEEELASVKGERDSLSQEKETLATEKTEQASQIETLQQELTSQKEELEELRAYKKEQEEAATRAEQIKTIKTAIEEAGLEADVEAEADYWLNMSEDVLKTTISKMSEIRKVSKASKKINVPQMSTETDDNVATVRAGLKSLKEARK